MTEEPMVGAYPAPPRSEVDSSLGKRVHAYEYVGRVIDISDPNLEGFGGYARLLRNRLGCIAGRPIKGQLGNPRERALCPRWRRS